MLDIQNLEESYSNIANLQNWMRDQEQNFFLLKTTTNDAYSQYFNCTIMLIFHIQTIKNIKPKRVCYFKNTLCSS